METAKRFMIMRQFMAFMMVCVGALTVIGCSDDDDEKKLAAPELNNASAITANGFTVNWNTVADAEKYLLDVSTSSTFTTYVDGYNKKEVLVAQAFDVSDLATNSTNVVGLAAGTKYYFRLYSKRGDRVSTPSVVKDATTAAE